MRPMVAVAGLVTACLLACGGGDPVSPPSSVPPPPPPPPGPPAPVASIALSQSAATLNVQATLQLTATPRDIAGNALTGRTITWTSSAPGVASVTPSGLVTGVVPGTAVIEAASGGVKAEATITVATAAGNATEILAGTIVLPAGAKIAPAALQVRNSLGKAPVAAAGTYALRSLKGASQLATVETPDGRPILLGWLKPQQTTVTARSTAEALAWFDLGGYLLPKEGRAFLFQELARRAEVANLENAITAALTADPATVSLDIESVHQARRVLQAAMMPKAGAGLRQARSPSNIVTIDPAATKSGILVDEPDLNIIRLRNDWRRRGVALLDRVSYVSETGDTIPSKSRIARADIPPTFGIVSISQTLEDLITGNLPWVPIEIDRMSTPIFPVNARSTQYRLKVLGAGNLTTSDWNALSTDEQQELVLTTGKALFVDVVLPMLQNVILESDVAGDAIDRALSFPAAANALSDAIGILYEQSEEIFRAAWNNDFSGSVGALIIALTQGDAFQQAAFEVASLVAFQLVPGAFESVDAAVTVSQFGKAVLRVVGKIDLALTVADACVQGWYVLQSRAVEVWNLQVNASKISLTPPASRIGQRDTVRLTAKVLGLGELAPGAILEYKWTVTGGRGLLNDGSKNGTQFLSSKNSVKYTAGTASGIDQVTVEVSRKQAGTTTVAIGSAKASVEVRDLVIRLVPEKVSLSYGEWKKFTVTVPDELKENAQIRYLWTTTGKFGSFERGATSLETHHPEIVYSARSPTDGSDVVAVEVLGLTVPPGGIGYVTSLGSDQALVKVEQRKSIIFGSWRVESYDQPNDRVCVVSYITFPRVSGAYAYTVHAYNFYDFAIGVSEKNFTVYEDDESMLPCGPGNGWGRSGWGGSLYWQFWSGSSGAASGGANADAWHRSRLLGMIVEVTVHFR